MRNTVRDWTQEGRLYVWRYANARRGWDGWHLAADPAGCRSFRNLLDRMHGGPPCHRTLMLENVTDAVLRVPNYRQNRPAEQFQKLRVEYQPSSEDLFFVPEAPLLVLTGGDRRLRKLAAALAQVENGGGDFGIDTSDDKRTKSWMFWWMPDVNYYYRGKS